MNETTEPRRYPLSELVASSGLTEAALARRVGLSGTTLIKARELGFVESAAERYACRIGLTPLEVWFDWGQVPCANERCDNLFAPLRKGHTYCDTRCYQRQYQREAARRRYAADADYRAAKVAAARKYRAESRRAISVRNRQYRERNADEMAAARRRYYEANRERLLERQREYDRNRRRQSVA